MAVDACRFSWPPQEAAARFPGPGASRGSPLSLPWAWRLTPRPPARLARGPGRQSLSGHSPIPGLPSPAAPCLPRPQPGASSAPTSHRPPPPPTRARCAPPPPPPTTPPHTPPEPTQRPRPGPAGHLAFPPLLSSPLLSSPLLSSALLQTALLSSARPGSARLSPRLHRTSLPAHPRPRGHGRRHTPAQKRQPRPVALPPPRFPWPPTRPRP